MVVFDTSFVLLAAIKQPPPAGSRWGVPPARSPERMAALLEHLGSQRVVIGIPSPVFAEVGVKLAPRHSVQEIRKVLLGQGALFSVLSFDERSASILAMEEARVRRDSGNKKFPAEADTWTKVRFDRQIAAIAKANGAQALYVQDQNLGQHARRLGLTVLSLENVSIPPTQGALGLDAPD